jgi:hypothetical protein
MRIDSNSPVSDAGKLGFSRSAWLFQVFNMGHGRVVGTKMDKDAHLAVTVELDGGERKVFTFSYLDEADPT